MVLYERHRRRERKREDGKKTEEVERRKERWRQQGREDGKILKGPNYFKPNIKDILDR